jgi:SAM-dependent methyltransferase
LNAPLKHDSFAIARRRFAEHRIASAYNQAGADYATYADGGPGDLYEFSGQYAYGDSQTWREIDARLQTLAQLGKRRLRVLDLGCGPGTWLRRVIKRALELGFETIAARGIDIAEAQVEQARAQCRRLPSYVQLDFEVRDVLDPLPEWDGTVDLCLCLYGVLNHVPPGDLGDVLDEVARVTSGHFITTVRSIGSTPTIYVESIEAARAFRQDNKFDRLDVELSNGRRISFNSHLFGAVELAAVAAKHFEVEDLRGLDLFHNRFAADPRWNPPNAVATQLMSRELDQLEQLYCRAPEFIDHATHLLLTAKARTVRRGRG